MGLCASNTVEGEGIQKEEKQASKNVDQFLMSDRMNDLQVNKLLLLGAGGSGKSTVFKQMINIYGKGFSEKERASYAHIIAGNIILSAKILCEQSGNYGPMNPSLADSRKFIESLPEETDFTKEMAYHIKRIWTDSGVQRTYENRSKFQLSDSTHYFFDRLDEIASDSYIPTQQDILRSRVHTTGIVEQNFEIDGNPFKMLDVGGQRSERKKWVHCFENVTAVLFVAAISEYDQLLFEDEQTNRITESLELFEEISNSEWFTRTAIILFLNKRDLFAEKLLRVPLASFWPDFQGGKDYDQACTFMRELFEARAQDKDVYCHVTCATDTNNIATVFIAVKDVVIKRGLARAGLM